MKESFATTIVADEAALRRIIAEEVRRAVDVTIKERADTPADGTLMTSEELAALLRIDVRTLRRLEHARSIPRSIVIGDRTKRWSRRSIDKWLRKREQRA